MELFNLLAGFHFDLVILSKHFVADRAPSVVFIAHIPSFVVFVFFWLVKVNVDGRFLGLFLKAIKSRGAKALMSTMPP